MIKQVQLEIAVWLHMDIMNTNVRRFRKHIVYHMDYVYGLHFIAVWHYICLYPSELCQGHCDNHMITLVQSSNP